MTTTISRMDRPQIFFVVGLRSYALRERVELRYQKLIKKGLLPLFASLFSALVSFNSFLSTNKESCLNGTWASKEITSPSVKRNFIEKKIWLFLLSTTSYPANSRCISGHRFSSRKCVCCSQANYKQLFDDFRKKKFRMLSEGCTTVSDHFPKITKNGSRVAQWWEPSHSTNRARVQISASTPSVGKGCFWLSPCSERFFSGYSGFPLNLKTNTFKFQIPNFGPRAHPLDPSMFTLDFGFNFSGRAIKQNRSYFGFPHLRVHRNVPESWRN